MQKWHRKQASGPRRCEGVVATQGENAYDIPLNTRYVEYLGNVE
jgi:hypothetical protein